MIIRHPLQRLVSAFHYLFTVIDSKMKHDYILGRHQKHKYLMSVGISLMLLIFE